MLPGAVVPLLTRNRVVQVVAPLVVLAIQIAYRIIYYPVAKLSRNCLVNLTGEAPGYFDY